MKNKHSSIDGFVPRRAGSQLGSQHLGSQSAEPTTSTGLRPPGEVDASTKSYTLQRSGEGLSRTDIDESLRGIDAEQPELPKKGRRRRRRKGEPTSRKRRIIKWVIIGLIVMLLAVGGWFAYHILSASGNIFKGNIFDLIQSQPLKEDADGRSNILIFGTSEDDPGHDGANLTDSIMVLSIDQDKKNAFMISVPRDLWVQYGKSCPAGNEGKINAVYMCNFNNGADETAGANALKDKVSEVFGMDIQYYAHVNYTVVRDAVNAVGGIDVDIEGDGPVPYGVKPGSVLDENFDWRCNYTCNYVKYSPGVHHLDGNHALALARARGDVVPTYGFANSNFDREKNQQKIIKALQEKAVSVGTLANIGKVTSLIDSLGKNLRTNFQTKEIRTLMSLGTDIKSDQIQSISLVDQDHPVVGTGNVDGQSVVEPLAGTYDYSDIQQYIKQQISSDPAVREQAHIVVLNGSGVAGAAQTEADKLSAKGLNITAVDNAPAGTYPDIEIYQLGTGNTATKAKLESIYHVDVKAGTPPATVSSSTDFVIIVGTAHS